MSSSLRPIADVAADLGLGSSDLVQHGPTRAEVSLATLDARPALPGEGRYVLVTGMTPTKAGEGKTVTTIGLSMGLCRLGKRAVAALRQSSLGPTLGLKGGGAGGGAACIAPLEEALLGLGADLFAVESANNVLAARIDDVLRRADGSGIDLDPDQVSWRRVIDMDDRALRRIVVALDDTGTRTRTTGFDITAASEVMAVLSLARDLPDLRRRLASIVVGPDRSGAPVTAEALGAAGAMAVLLRDALRPNLLQTSEGTPVLVHGGPFANIAHGCSSVVADRIALPRADVVVTEGGFGADLGAVKFLELKCPVVGRGPDAVVIVVTAKAVLEHGERLGVAGHPAAVAAAGVANVEHHVGVLRSTGIPVVVAVNRFPDDDPTVLAVIDERARAAGAFAVVPHEAYVRGGAGAEALAAAVLDACERGGADHRPLVDPGAPVRTKVERLATGVFGADGVDWSPEAEAQLDRLDAGGFGSLPVCVAKTHLSISHDPSLAGAPRGHRFPVRSLRLYAGAGFVTVYAGDILTMPAFGARPRFVEMDLGPDGEVLGLA